MNTRKDIIGYYVCNTWTGEVYIRKQYEWLQHMSVQEILKSHNIDIDTVDSVDYDEEEMFLDIQVKF